MLLSGDLMNKRVLSGWLGGLLIVVNCCFAVQAADDNDIAKNYRKAARKYRFDLKAKAVFPHPIEGEQLPLEEIEEELDRFFEALDELGVSFVKKSGLKKVMICRRISLNGMPCAGIARGDTMYLKKGFRKRTVYHEMFHIFDPKRSNKKWQRLNHKDFRYRGINFPDRPVSKRMRNKLKRHYRKIDRDFSKDFVSNYAQTNEVEDRAETFAFMIDEGTRFVTRADKSNVLFNKMLFMVDLTDRGSLLGKEYWRRKLGQDFSRSKMRKVED